MCELFKDDPDVGIVIKTNSGRLTKIDRQVTTDTLKKLLSEVRSGPYPKVYLLHGDMSDQEVASLYRDPKIKALVSLTRGEGFGLPTLEAAASGLPVIATNWSGHLDFMNLGKFIPVNYAKERIHESLVNDNIFCELASWANPIEDDAKNKILKFRKKSQIPKQWALELKNKLKKTHSYDSIAKLYDAEIGILIE